MNYTDNMLKEIQDLFTEGSAYESIIGQNKNDRKLLITDIAITKVPYVKYPDVSPDECSKLHELEVLLLGLSQKENNSNEVAITYRLYKEPNETEDDRIAIVYGDEHEVDLGADTKTFHLLQSERLAIINMHNHPNCSNFSLYDISFFLRNDSVKLLILLSNKGELNYLSKSEDYSRMHNVALLLDVFRKVVPNSVQDMVINLKRISTSDMLKATSTWIKEAQHYGIRYEHVLNSERGVECNDESTRKENNTQGTAEVRDEDEWER
jgi:hypothetical protein